MNTIKVTLYTDGSASVISNFREYDEVFTLSGSQAKKIIEMIQLDANVKLKKHCDDYLKEIDKWAKLEVKYQQVDLTDIKERVI